MKYILKLFPDIYERNDIFEKDLKITKHILRINKKHTEIILTTDLVLMYRSIEEKRDFDRLRGILYEGLYIYYQDDYDEEIKSMIKSDIKAKITSYV